MCLEELFCPFTRDALNFQQPEIYAAPHRPAVFMFPLSLSRHHCAVCRSALSFCSVTAHAHRKSRVRSNNAPTRKVYVTLVYLLLFAVELLCCDMQYRADLGNTMVCSHSLIIHVYLIFLYTESSFFINFPLIDAIWWALAHIIRDHISVWMYDRETSVFLYHTHTHTLKCAWRLNEDKNTQTTSPELLWVTSWAFHRFIWVKLSLYRIHTEM